MAINNCTDILTDLMVLTDYRLENDPARSRTSLSYTNAESRPMCASAILWASSKEYVYGTSIQWLVEFGWHQIQISSQEVFDRSVSLEPSTVL